MLSRKILLLFFIMMSLFTSQTLFAAGNTPIGLLQYMADNMIAGLKAHRATLKTKPQIVYNLAYKYVVPYADIAEMSKRVLPVQTWRSATPAQREEFQKQFTRTLIRTYASALSAYKDQSMRFFPIRGNYQNAHSVEVNGAIISSTSQPIHVTYRLVRVGGEWKLYDLSVEGVSMLESFRAQFSGLLARGNMDQLLNRLSAHSHRNR